MEFEKVLLGTEGKKNLEVDISYMHLIHAHIKRYVWLFDHIKDFKIKEAKNYKDKHVMDDVTYSNMRFKLGVELYFYDSMNKSLTNSLFTISYNKFIVQLLKACEVFEEQFELKPTYKDYSKKIKKGSDFDRIHKYFINVCKIDASELNHFHDTSDTYCKVRNVITHGLNNSMYKIDESLKKKILFDNRIILEDDIFQIHDCQYIVDFVNKCIGYINNVAIQFEIQKRG